MTAEIEVPRREPRRDHRPGGKRRRPVLRRRGRQAHTLQPVRHPLHVESEGAIPAGGTRCEWNLPSRRRLSKGGTATLAIDGKKVGAGTSRRGGDDLRPMMVVTSAATPGFVSQGLRAVNEFSGRVKGVQIATRRGLEAIPHMVSARKRCACDGAAVSRWLTRTRRIAGDFSLVWVDACSSPSDALATETLDELPHRRILTIALFAGCRSRSCPCSRAVRVERQTLHPLLV